MEDPSACTRAKETPEGGGYRVEEVVEEREEGERGYARRDERSAARAARKNASCRMLQYRHFSAFFAVFAVSELSAELCREEGLLKCPFASTSRRICRETG